MQDAMLQTWLESYVIAHTLDAILGRLQAAMDSSIVAHHVKRHAQAADIPLCLTRRPVSSYFDQLGPLTALKSRGA